MQKNRRTKKKKNKWLPDNRDDFFSAFNSATDLYAFNQIAQIISLNVHHNFFFFFDFVFVGSTIWPILAYGKQCESILTELWYRRSDDLFLFCMCFFFCFEREIPMAHKSSLNFVLDAENEKKIQYSTTFVTCKSKVCVCVRGSVQKYYRKYSFHDHLEGSKRRKNNCSF